MNDRDAQRNAATVGRLYKALDHADGKAMAACYTHDATFTDPVFRDLRGEEVGRMWRMLCAGAKDLEAKATRVVVAGDEGLADWEATYTFSRTGRRVQNRIRATFTFRDGLIATQRDRFRFWLWSGRALGASGWLLGWTPLVKSKVRKDARRRLDAFR